MYGGMMYVSTYQQINVTTKPWHSSSLQPNSIRIRRHHCDHFCVIVYMVDLNIKKNIKNKIPSPVANSVLFTCLIRRCNITCWKFFQNLGHHLPQGMAMIASPLPLVDIAPYLSIQKFVLCILCMDTGWNEIFTFVQRLCANCGLTTILSSHFSGKL